MPDKYKVLFVQRNYPHYRRAIFQKLATHPLIDLTLLYGEQAGPGGLANVADDPIVRCVVRPIWFVPGTGRKVCSIPHMLEYVRRERWDVLIVSNDLYCLNLFPALYAARRRNTKICIFSIGFPQYKQWLRDKVRVWLAHRVDAMILYSYAHRQRYIDLGVPGEKIFVAPNAVDVDGIRKAEAQMTPESLRDFKVRNGLEGHRVLIHAGRMVENKRLDLLLRAAAQVIRKVPALKLVLLGDGPMTEPWKRLAQELEMADHVLWPGTVVNHEELCYWFHSSDLCVAPGQQGLIANLSHSYGVPLITSDCERLQGPEIQVFTNGKTGLLYAYENVHDLADKISNLLVDEDRRLQMSSSARDVVFNQFTIDTMCQGFIDGIQYVMPR
ncbi:MAG: glycosyltransferase family 4 protein [Phycisphaerae bacterium]|nr:glycosyltransferase family 4 protein [Phycisphaerae bacterium]